MMEKPGHIISISGRFLNFHSEPGADDTPLSLSSGLRLATSKKKRISETSWPDDSLNIPKRLKSPAFCAKRFGATAKETPGVCDSLGR